MLDSLPVQVVVKEVWALWAATRGSIGQNQIKTRRLNTRWQWQCAWQRGGAPLSQRLFLPALPLRSSRLSGAAWSDQGSQGAKRSERNCQQWWLVQDPAGPLLPRLRAGLPPNTGATPGTRLAPPQASLPAQGLQLQLRLQLRD